MKPLKLLLHVCCGPCATYPVPFLREKGFEVWGYFYNPNIHPFTEYAKRRESFYRYAELDKLMIIKNDEYSFEDYWQRVSFREGRRCFFCYHLRLEQTARIARRGKFEGFSTTLLVSPFQKHDLIRETGESMADKYGVPFVYFDFREGFKETVVRSKALGLYRQQYCGCLFSEVERFQPSKKGDFADGRNG